ncbi:hypothetical protein CN338_04795 [Bacillus cereus]|nr:hypothetical protein CN338_04795 [Bacillus cereus]
MLTKRYFYKRFLKLFILFVKLILGMKKAPHEIDREGKKGKGNYLICNKAERQLLVFYFVVVC